MQTDAWKHIRIKEGGRTTQFVPLQQYQRRDRIFVYYLVTVHISAVYGVYKAIEFLYQWAVS